MASVLARRQGQATAGAGLKSSVMLQHCLALGKRLDLRTGVEGDDDAEEVSLGVSWYF